MAYLLDDLTPQSPLDDVIEAYLEDLNERVTHCKDFRKSSLRPYRVGLGHVRRRLGSVPISALRTPQILGTVRTLAKDKDGQPKPTRAKSALSKIRTVLNWARTLGLRNDNPAADLRFRVPKAIPVVLTWEQFTAICAGLRDEASGRWRPLKRRARTGHAQRSAAPECQLVQLLCAARGKELREATVDMIDTDGRCLVMRGKNGKVRRVYLPGDTWSMVLRRAAEVQTGYLFPNRKGDGPIGANACRDSFQRSCRRAGLRGVKPHHVRHLLATRGAEEGFSDEELADALGHDVETFRRHYRHAAITPGARNALEWHAGLKQGSRRGEVRRG